MFSAYKDTIEDGDLVLGWMTRTAIKPIVVEKKEGLFNTRYGAFPHRNMDKYGAQLGSMSKQGFIHLIHPTPELWTLSLPHRTQIVYTTDSSYIVEEMTLCEHIFGAVQPLQRAGIATGLHERPFQTPVKKETPPIYEKMQL